MTRLLEISGLKVHFRTDDGWVRAVDGVDIGVDRGETVSIVGESGCGKTVTAKTVLKLIDMPPGRIVAGSIHWQGRDLVPADAAEMRAIRAKANFYCSHCLLLLTSQPWRRSGTQRCRSPSHRTAS